MILNRARHSIRINKPRVRSIVPLGSPENSGLVRFACHTEESSGQSACLDHDLKMESF